ncbi:alpha/beta hydrolase [Nakamurella alba]|uniref:alpha/beta hydrolase n=1 Tax=Nakamurella alba TaxID=2665158 RepID=UPI002AC31F79|nr:alpha/beta hydrolase [Nakamurella alba]
MPFALDPQVATGLLALLGDGPPPVPPPAGDVFTRRQNAAVTFAVFADLQPAPSGVAVTHLTVTADDGAQLDARWYAREAGGASGPAVLYLHGGGMIAGDLKGYDPIIARYVAASGVPMLAVEYRLAPEFPDPVPVRDCFAALRHLAEHADELGVDRSRIAVMGDSAGGGLAAGVALLARDENGPALSRQILVYPMLDDTNVTPDPQLVPFLTWSYDDNVTGWGALLGEAPQQVSPYAAPTRATDLTGLPPAYLDVGELDIFRDEDLEYARRLTDAGVPTEFHLHPGAPHGFEAFAPGADVAQRAIADRLRVLRSL